MLAACQHHPEFDEFFLPGCFGIYIPFGRVTPNWWFGLVAWRFEPLAFAEDKWNPPIQTTNWREAEVLAVPPMFAGAPILIRGKNGGYGKDGGFRTHKWGQLPDGTGPIQS